VDVRKEIAMLTHAQEKKLFAVVLISLTTLTAFAQVTRRGQLSAKPAAASATSNSSAPLFLPAVTYDSGGFEPSSVG
jgi:hypothetical protein